MNKYFLNLPDVDQMSLENARSYIQKMLVQLNKEKKQITLCFSKNSTWKWGNANFLDDRVDYSEIRQKLAARPVNDYCLMDESLFRFVKVMGFAPDNGIDFGELQAIGDYFITFKKIPTTSAKKRLELYRRTNYSSIQSDLRQHSAERGLGESDSLLEELINGNEELFNFELWFVVSDRDIRVLDEKTEVVCSSLNTKEIQSRVETFGITHAVSQFLGENDTIRFPLVAHSSFIINLLPLSQEKIMSEGYTFKSRNHADLNFHLFDTRASSFGMTISGATGQGKSKLGNKIIQEEIERGAKCVVLDRNASYAKTCKYYGGVELSSGFNPLQFKDVRYLKSLLISVLPAKSSNLELEGELFLFLKELELEDIHSLGDLVEIVGKKFPIIRSCFAELIEHFDETHIPSTDLLYLDFANYPDQIRPIVLVFVIQYFYSLSGKKIILLDECHHLLRNNISFVESLFRELRKQQGAPIALTQNFADFVSSDIGRVIANNSFYKVFLRQNVEISSFVTEEEQSLIQGLETVKGVFSEFYLKSALSNKVMRFFPTDLEYELFTSDYQDNSNQKKFFENLLISGFDFRKTMDAWTRIKYAMD